MEGRDRTSVMPDLVLRDERFHRRFRPVAKTIANEGSASLDFGSWRKHRIRDHPVDIRPHRTPAHMKRISALWQLVLAAALAPALVAQQITTAERAQIDSAARTVLRATGAPSASIAIVRGGQLVYENAYGDARISPRTPASTSMRYAIGSVSKQFTAAAILLLAEDGKLSLDDRISKWHPELTRAGDVSIRQLLSMTSGYQDYWPQDYVFTDMQRPTTSDAILRRW